MSVAITNTHNTMGVRHLNGLRTRSFKANRPGLTGYIALGALGDVVDPDTISALTAAGYDPITLQSLVAQGATDGQLQNLPYGPGTTANDMGSGLYNLQVQLGGAPPPIGSSVIQPLMTGTQFQASLGLPGGSVGTSGLTAAGSGLVAPTLALPSQPSTALGFVEANASWILILALLAIVAPPLLKKL